MTKEDATTKQAVRTTLQERLEWVLSHREWTANRWCTAAGVDRGVLRQAFSRASDDVSLTVDKLVKLADAARVSVGWLATGRGSPDAGEEPAEVFTLQRKQRSLHDKQAAIRRHAAAIEEVVAESIRVEIARELVERVPAARGEVEGWLAGYGLTLEGDQ